ncbi:MAG: hypothetical protein J7518_07290 [Nocardioidaceae bacterium]|nr:hypothetical protein [Nocardioidaceae bacterium]
MGDVELHDEVVVWLGSLPEHEWDRVVVVVDRRAREVAAECRRRFP